MGGPAYWCAGSFARVPGGQVTLGTHTPNPIRRFMTPLPAISCRIRAMIAAPSCVSNLKASPVGRSRCRQSRSRFLRCDPGDQASIGRTPGVVRLSRELDESLA